MAANTESQGAKGPLLYENWKGYLSGVAEHEAVEYPLFTDADVAGHLVSEDRPFLLLNTTPLIRGQYQVPSIILRVSNHLPPQDDFEILSATGTDATLYHGGSISDEIAALASLYLGPRLLAGGANREFERNGDPRCYPRAFEGSIQPLLLKRPDRAPMLPRALGRHDI